MRIRNDCSTWPSTSTASKPSRRHSPGSRWQRRGEVLVDEEALSLILGSKRVDARSFLNDAVRVAVADTRAQRAVAIVTRAASAWAVMPQSR